MEKRKLLTDHLWLIQIEADFLYFDNYHAGIYMPKVGGVAKPWKP